MRQTSIIGNNGTIITHNYPSPRSPTASNALQAAPAKRCIDEAEFDARRAPPPRAFFFFGGGKWAPKRGPGPTRRAPVPRARAGRIRAFPRTLPACLPACLVPPPPLPPQIALSLGLSQPSR